MNVELESLGLTHCCCLFTVYVTLGSLFYTSLCSVVSNPRDRTPPGSSVHGFSQARIQKWVAISFSRVSSQPRDWTLCISCVSCIGRLMTAGAMQNGNSSPCPGFFTKVVKSGSRMLILERTQVFSSQTVPALTPPSRVHWHQGLNLPGPWDSLTCGWAWWHWPQKAFEKCLDLRCLAPSRHWGNHLSLLCVFTCLSHFEVKWGVECENVFSVLCFVLVIFQVFFFKKNNLPSTAWHCCYCSVTKSHPTLCNPMNCGMPGFPVLHCLSEFAQTPVYWVGDTMWPSCPLLFLPSIFPIIRVFSNELALHIRWPKYWSCSFSLSPYSEYSGLISFRSDWFDLLAAQVSLKSLLQHHSSKGSILQCSAYFMIQLSHPYTTTGKNHSFD